MKPKTNSNHHDSPKKVFDVSRPGKTLAETTSRSVIVGHKPQVQDPMMMHPGEQHALMDAKHKVAVTPSAPVVAGSEQQLPGSGAASEAAPLGVESKLTPDVPESIEPITSGEAPSVATLTEQLPLEEQRQMTPAAPEEPPVSHATGAGSVSSSAPEDSVAAILSQGAQEAIATPESQEPLPDISDAHVYPPTTMIVSHHDKSARIGKSLLWLLIVLVLVAVLVDILLDAGFFVLNVPHTDFF